MRGLLYALSVVGVVALAWWAYHQGYETRQTAREVAQLQRQLGRAHEELGILKAEWAYLNRPDRLRVLAEMNFERLGLMPLAPEQFGTVTQIGYPPPAPEPNPALNPGEVTLSMDTVGRIQHVQGALPAPVPQLIQPAPHTPEPQLVP